jgi:hypothetical protein
MGNPNRKPEGSNLGLILGVVFGVLVVLIAVGAIIAIRIQRQRAAVPESEDAEAVATQTFYSDNRAETEATFELAFENPVFDTQQDLEMGDAAFSDDMNEML